MTLNSMCKPGLSMRHGGFLRRSQTHSARIVESHAMDRPTPPLVSVIIPTYNRGADLALTVESALRQTCSADFEVIIVDDASTDNTWEVACSFAGDPRVRVICHDHNLGVSGATNTGIRQAAW